MYDFHARHYDPQLGRWFTPDPAMQFSNPYLAMGNNPVMYVDPDGELALTFLGTKTTFLFDFLKTGFTDGGFEFWNWGSQNFDDAWRGFDPSAEWSKTNKAWRIDIGRFKTDSDKNIIGRGWQLLKRNTWQLPNTVAGNWQSHANNLSGNVERVDYFHGATVVYKYGEGRTHSSVGGYINTWEYRTNGERNNTDYGNATLLHEYGHYLQEQAFGPLTLFSGLNSGLSAGFGSNRDGRPFNTLDNHQEAWFEQDANYRARKYFSDKEGFRNFEVLIDYSALQNFNRLYPDQLKSRRFWWNMPPFTIPHIFYTAFINTGP
jgi:hypothetical protein